jgi:hypothetical protein
LIGIILVLDPVCLLLQDRNSVLLSQPLHG